jgi:hypothetical protein
MAGKMLPCKVKIRQHMSEIPQLHSPHLYQASTSMHQAIFYQNMKNMFPLTYGMYVPIANIVNLLVFQSCFTFILYLYLPKKSMYTILKRSALLLQP